MESEFFEQIVLQWYEPLYRFAFSLAQSEADAWDLTQQTFYIWATKGDQLRDRSRIKAWLFTILHRLYLGAWKKTARFPQLELRESAEELPAVPPEILDSTDAAQALECLRELQEPYRAAVSLFYLEDRSYKEIAEILEVPVGTVRSRLARGIAQLQQSILAGTGACASAEMA